MKCENNKKNESYILNDCQTCSMLRILSEGKGVDPARIPRDYKACTPYTIMLTILLQ